MFNFHPYATAYGMTSPPELIFTSVTFNDVFYEMNSLVDFNIGGYVTVTNSNFQRISSCGGIIKNENPTITNYLPAMAGYTQYLNHFNLRKNTIVSDHDCAATQCFKVDITGTTFMSFNYLKYRSTSGSNGSVTNPSNGVLNRGALLHLIDFSGEVIFTGCTVNDVETRISSCGVSCITAFFSADEALLLYGTEKTNAKIYMIYLLNHERGVLIQGTWTDVTSSAELIYIQQGNLTPDSPIIIYKNVITNVGAYNEGTGIEIIRYVTTDFESTDSATITSLLTTGSLTPCAGVALLENVMSKVISCTPSGEQIHLKCYGSGGTTYAPSLTADELAAINHTVINNYSFTLDSVTKTFDMNYVHFNENTVSDVIGSPEAPLFAIEGFVKVKISNNVFLNNGRFLENLVGEWTALDNYRTFSFDSLTSF
jgi:hypothetical protein